MARPTNKERIIRLIRETGTPFIPEKYLSPEALADEHHRKVCARRTVSLGAIREYLGKAALAETTEMVMDGTLILMLDEGHRDDAALGGRSPLWVAVRADSEV